MDTKSEYYLTPVVTERRLKELYKYVRESTFLLTATNPKLNVTYNGKYLSIHKKWREDVAEQLSRIQDADTQLWKYIAHLKLFSKVSNSETVIAFGEIPVDNLLLDELKDEDKADFSKVAVKISFDQDTESNWFKDSLQSEREIVEHIFTLLYENHHCMNVVGFLANKDCKSGTISLESPFEKSPVAQQEMKIYTDDLLWKIYNRGYNTTMAHILIMEYVNGGSLMKLLENISDGYALNFTQNDFVCILTQLYWTLYCFELLGLSHNDLHLGNILLKILSKPEILPFAIADENGVMHIVRIQTRYIIKVYDMDHASVYFPGVSRNTELDLLWCHNIGHCNRPSPKFDIGTVNFNILKAVEKLSDVYPQWSRFLISCLGETNWNAYSKLTSQQFAKALSKDENITTRLKSPSECLWHLWKNFDTPLEQTSQVSHCFQLPPRYVVQMDTPRKTMLRANHYDPELKPYHFDVVNAQLHPMIEEIYVEELQKYESAKTLRHILQSWGPELNVNGFKWTTAAAELHKAYGLRTQNYPKHQLFLLACLFLTCPIYYGLTEIVEKKFNSIFISKTSVDSLKRMELLIWQTFDDCLPVQIPILYNMNRRSSY